MVAAVLLAVCLSADPPAKADSLYHPTRVGARWVYEFDDEREIVEAVTKVERTADGTAVSTTPEETAGRVVRPKTVVVSDKGLVLRAEGDKPGDPPRWLLKLPARAGDSWELRDGKNAGRAVVRGTERVKTRTATYDAVRVDFEDRAGKGRGAVSFWYAPGVGLVKAVYGGKTTMWLKTFTPGPG